MNKIANPGTVYYVPELNRPVSLAMNLFLIRVNPALADQHYVYYALKINEPYIKTFSTGTAATTITKKAVRELEFPLPPLETQRRIAGILSAYDDLIENNTRRIQALEEAAQALYREWFVEFRFPGYEDTEFVEHPDFGEIPAGWEIKSLKEILSLIHGYSFKSAQFTDEPKEKILVRMGNFKETGGLKFDSKTKYLLTDDYKDKFDLEPYDLVMVLSDVTREGRIIGKVGFIPNDNRKYVLNQRVARIEIEDDLKTFFYLYFNSQGFRDHCLSRANSATVLNLSNSHIYAHTIPFPSQEFIEQLNETVTSILNQIEILNIKNDVLRETRDLLLPRLISGELDVDELDIEMG